jgi:GTP pyrophosphokinase
MRAYTFEPLFVSLRKVQAPPSADHKDIIRIAPDADEIAAVEKLMQSLPDLYSDQEYLQVIRAYMVASHAHRNQHRESGEPYILHPIAVAQIIAELGMDPICLCAGLLHDVAEDTEYTVDYIGEQFGADVKTLVDGVTKLKRINEIGSVRAGVANHKAESLRKMFIAMVDDIRVVVIKLADRLHNMRTLGGQKEHKRRRIARETLEIFAPLANRVGIWSIKSELEDLSFRYLEPNTYKDLVKAVLHKQSEQERLIIVAKNDLERELAKHGIRASVTGRTKHIYSIYRKMHRKHVGFDQIYDVLALRVIVTNETECYTALGVVHSMWRPIPGEFDDYIAAPKNNMYRSLHTSVLSHRSGRPMEIQIRTEAMHREAEFGIAAHWQYKEQQRSTDAFVNNKVNYMRHWLRQVMEWRNEVSDAEEFVNGMKSDLFNEHVFIFTPQGDIIDLPAGSTPIDFAYAIHTELGHRCRSAYVNGKMVGLDYKLQNSDQVEIIAAKRGGPSRDWLNPNLEYVATHRARTKIRAWLRKQAREENIQRGRQALERELKRLAFNISFEDLGKLFNYEKVDDFLAAIGYGDVNPQQIAQKSLDQEQRDRANVFSVDDFLTRDPASSPRREDGGEFSIHGVSGLLTNLARCCKPFPGDSIVGYVTRGRGVTIHRTDCPNMQAAIRKGVDGRLLDVQWSSKSDQRYPIEIAVNALDRPGLVRDIAILVADEHINMSHVSAQTAHKNHLAVITATLEIEDATQLSRILTKLERVPNVIDAVRVVPTKPKNGTTGLHANP